MQATIRFSLILLITAGLLGSCADKDKFQNKMKGIWILKSRALPEGEQIVPPSISGRLEWFPMDVDAGTAHVSILTTHGGEGLQVHGSHYTLNDHARFSQVSYLEIGGGVSKTHDKTFAAGRKTISGTIQVEGARITFRHESGPVYVFEGSQLTIEHPDGTTDVLMK